MAYIYDVIVAGIGPGSDLVTFLTFGLGIGEATAMMKGSAAVTDSAVNGAVAANARVWNGSEADSAVNGGAGSNS